MPPQIIAGDIREHDASDFKSALQAAAITRIDTAARYANGESEKKIGSAKLGNDFTIDTKILLPSDTADGSLTAEAIDKSLTNSLDVLGVDRVNVLYCHGPDFKTPIAEQAKGFDEQYRKGRFAFLGVSNFPPSMVEEWLDIAAKEGYVKPSVYEGQYNLFCRGYETTLFPLLRRHGMGLTAFSPLAGGFLLGNFTPNGVRGGSRFAQQTPFTTWYDQPSMHQGITRFRSISEKSGIGMDELSLRWLMYHSALSDNDGIILGASKTTQIGKNVAQIAKGPLQDDVVAELNALWDVVGEEAMKIVDHDGYFMGRKRV